MSLDGDAPPLVDELLATLTLPTGKLGSVTRKRHELDVLINVTPPVTRDVILQHYEMFNERYEKLENAVKEEFRKSLAAEDHITLVNWKTKFESDFSDIHAKMREWFSANQRTASPPQNNDIVFPEAQRDDDVLSRKSHVSRKSEATSKSTGSSFKSGKTEASAVLRAKLADRRAKREADDKYKLELDQLTKRMGEIKNERELNYEKNLEKEIEALEENSVNSNDPPFHFNQFISSQNKLVDVMIKNQQRGPLPYNEPTTFDGTDLTLFRPFLRSFNVNIESRCESDHDKLHYLEKYTSGDPQELVRSCFGRENSYQHAVQLLKHRYNNEYKIADSYLKKIEEYPTIKVDDGRSFERFAIFLTSCSTAMRDITELNQLNSPKEMLTIVKKLPYKYREKWRTVAYDLSSKKNIKPIFKHLVDFINEQSSIVNFPIFSDIADNKERERNNFSKSKNFLVSTNDVGDNTEDRLICTCCKKSNHVINKCVFFGKMLHEDKVKFIKENNLCFSCLKPDHYSSGCMKRDTCDKCQRRHPTILHYDNPNNKPVTHEENEPTRSFSYISSKTGETKISHAVLPVKIRVKGTKDFVETYIALDNFSSDCFMSDKLMNLLGVDGYKTDILLTTMEGKCLKRPTYAIHNLEIVDLDEANSTVIPTTYSSSNWPFERDDCPKEDDVANLPYLSNIPFSYLDADIGLLVGANMPQILKPLKVVGRGDAEPFAVLHKHGWSLNGPLKSDNQNKKYCHRIQLMRDNLDEKIDMLFKQDFIDVHKEEKGLSIDDQRWLQIMEHTCTLKDGHFEIALPFKNSEQIFPDNRQQVLDRLTSGRKRLLRNPKLCEEYSAFMKEMLLMGFAEEVPQNELKVEQGKVWYLVHHGVFHPVKNKLRIVFDCSLKFCGISLNDELLQGIDLTNGLLGVLMRFRQSKIAVSGDITKMFYQVRVPYNDRNYFRYFWYPDGDLSKEPIEYRLTVHVFGARSSPSCANFALKRTAILDTVNYSSDSLASVIHDFYVDDWIKSVDNNEDANKLINEVSNIISQGGFNLTSFCTNSRDLLPQIPVHKLSDKFQKVDLVNERLPLERTLGVLWNVQNDYFCIDIKLDNLRNTRRGILSATFSIYDPFGFVQPIIVVAKRLFQLACSRNLDWDCELPKDLYDRWNDWCGSVGNLINFKVPRCFMNDIYDTVVSFEIHTFCDGSETAYAAAVYLRIKTVSAVYCSLVMSKSRLTPVCRKTLTTIPRIELTAAHLGVKCCKIVKDELNFAIDRCIFWTDSLTVLKYISNDSARFQRFVSNKISFIRSFTEPGDWRYVPSAINISDIASRGMNVTDFLLCKQWIDGPDFLCLSEQLWPVCPVIDECDELEIKSKNLLIKKEVSFDDPVCNLFESCSSWYKIRKLVAWFLRLKYCLKNKCKLSGRLSISELASAEKAIFCYIQELFFADELSSIRAHGRFTKGSSLTKLCPFIDDSGLLRVGGRLDRLEERYEFKYPIILPSKCSITELLIRFIHIKVGHLGRKTVLTELRKNYWVISASAAIDRITRDCISCRKQHAKTSVQLMANLPVERFKSHEKPFSYIGIDCFGPFMVTRGRKSEKRYGIIFTCLSSRSVHLEVLHSLDTDSFLMAFSRFISRRGTVKTIRSDNGTNFVAGNKILNACINEWNKSSYNWMLRKNIEWIFQPPASSHFGGIWEREIRTIRKVLNGLLSEQNIRLTDERINTLMCEVENILNGRPLTEISNDIGDLEPLTPNHLLLSYSTITYPPGLFSDSDLFVRNRWRQVQYLADLFWSRWRKEYLPLLQRRQKWCTKQDNHKIGDLVLVTDQFLPRNQWCTGRIIDVHKDSYGNVRSAKIKVSKAVIVKNKVNCEVKELERPIVKLILLNR